MAAIRAWTVAAALLLAAGGAASEALEFGRLEPGEAEPGGGATSHAPRNANAFSHPSANMHFQRQIDFKVGDGIFRKTAGEMIEFVLERLFLHQRKLELAGHVGEGFLGGGSRPVRGEGRVGDEVMLEAQRVQRVLLRVVPERAKLPGKLGQAPGQCFVEKLVIAGQGSNAMRGHCVGHLQNDRCLPRL